MPKPAQRVSDARPKQAVFAASIRQFPKRLVVVSEGDSWFSYPLNANLADNIEMMSDFSMLRLEHNGDEAREILGTGSDQLKKLKYYLKNYPVEVLLMSAGGNDLVAKELKRLLNGRVAGSTWQSAVKLAQQLACSTTSWRVTRGCWTRAMRCARNARSWRTAIATSSPRAARPRDPLVSAARVRG